MSKNLEQEIHAALHLTKARRGSPEQIAFKTERVESSDHPALHKMPIIGIGNDQFDSSTSAPKTARKKTITKKQTPEVKAKVLSLRVTDDIYDLFAKMAADRHLTIAKLGSLVVENYVAQETKKK